MPSATTAQQLSKSRYNAFSFNNNLPSPFVKLLNAISIWAMGTPTLRSTVESVKSRCKREIGNFIARCVKIAFAIPKLPSAFSKSIGFTLCGMAEDPTSPALIFCLKYSIETYCQKSRHRSIKIVSIRFIPSKIAARLS